MGLLLVPLVGAMGLSDLFSTDTSASMPLIETVTEEV
jgi:hypothetical protein